MTAEAHVVRADALVLFGATGDLARKKLFPAVYEMEGRDVLDGMPVIGVASSDWDDDRLREHAGAIRSDGGLVEVADDPCGHVLHAVARLAGPLDGDPASGEVVHAEGVEPVHDPTVGTHPAHLVRSRPAAGPLGPRSLRSLTSSALGLRPGRSGHARSASLTSFAAGSQLR